MFSALQLLNNEVVDGSYAELGNVKNDKGALVGFGDVGNNRLDVDTFTNEGTAMFSALQNLKNEVVEGSYAELGNFKNNQGGLVGFGDIGKNRLDVDTFTNEGTAMFSAILLI